MSGFADSGKHPLRTSTHNASTHTSATRTTPQDTTPPETIITQAPEETINYSKVTFQWTGSDDTTPTSNLTYSYYLQGYDTGYSPLTPDTFKNYIDLPAGSYTFYVKSKDVLSSFRCFGTGIGHGNPSF